MHELNADSSVDFEILRLKKGPKMDVDELMRSAGFADLVQLVESEMKQLRDNNPDHQGGLQAEHDELTKRLRGWLMTLGNPDISQELRQALDQQYSTAQIRIREIEGEIMGLKSMDYQVGRAIDPVRIAEKLSQLQDLLASQNPTAVNVELSKHIEGIYCSNDGVVTIRICKLGALGEGVNLIPRQCGLSSNPEFSQDPSICVAVPRRRTPLDIGGGFEDRMVKKAEISFAVDPNRFAGLGPQWFTDHTFQIPARLCWAEEYAEEVALYRINNRATVEKTAEHFGKSIPTIRSAIRHAGELGGQASDEIMKLPRRPNWAEQNAAAVVEYFKRTKATLKQAVEYFGKSEPTIRKARNHFHRTRADEL